jgi:hypothetical protein
VPATESLRSLAVHDGDLATNGAGGAGRMTAAVAFGLVRAGPTSPIAWWTFPTVHADS